MVKTLDEIISDIKEALGDSATTDNGIALLENVSDTFNDATENSTIDWKEKYEQNDKSWREKYVTRFSQGTVEKEKEETEPKREEPSDEPPTKFEELFKDERSK